MTAGTPLDRNIGFDEFFAEYGGRRQIVVRGRKGLPALLWSILFGFPLVMLMDLANDDDVGSPLYFFAWVSLIPYAVSHRLGTRRVETAIVDGGGIAILPLGLRLQKAEINRVNLFRVNKGQPVAVTLNVRTDRIVYYCGSFEWVGKRVRFDIQDTPPDVREIEKGRSLERPL